MVILDDDVQYVPNDLWKIVALAREKNAPAGGVYVTREREPHPASLLNDGQEMKFGIGQKPVPIRYLATGFMAIPRKVVEDMVTHEGFETAHGKQKVVYCEMGVGRFPMYDVFSPFVIKEKSGKLHYLSEDWAFCERARQCGYEIWADPSIILQHRAYVSVTVHDLPQAGDARPSMLYDGAPSKGDSILVVGEDRYDGGSKQPELVSSTEG
jgi:hypothetical protein